MRKLTGYLLFCIIPVVAPAQFPDSVELKEITVDAYLAKRTLFSLPATLTRIDTLLHQWQPVSSPVNILNNIPGVRMEERSPGSYRFSIRGSLLRSPFGIRNIKIYADEFPLTDGGGNTYFNLIDLNAFNSIEVLRGPDGSLFGANSGGVVRLGTASGDTSHSTAIIGVGEYGSRYGRLATQQQFGQHQFSVSGTWQQYDGYRYHSALNKKYIQLSERWQYHPKAALHLFFFYADLFYQTPGGLTLHQWEQEPRAYRSATATLRGAAQQQAAIYNKTAYYGFSHRVRLSASSDFVAAVFGSHTAFENPFITNYEVRQENNIGARTWIEIRSRSDLQWHYYIGAETQQQKTAVSNYGNAAGNKDTLQSSDQLHAQQGFLFTRFTFSPSYRWNMEASLSMNLFQYRFRHLQPMEEEAQRVPFALQWMPRLAVSYQLHPLLALRTIVSRGYSPPTLAEIRPSDQLINRDLKAEAGWNYEAGFRWRDPRHVFSWDLAFFYYRLHDAIVRRVNDAGEEFFINAGGTSQLGIESQVNLLLVQNDHAFVRSWQVQESYTFSNFIFENYRNATADFSGKQLTGVPVHVAVTNTTLRFPSRFYFLAQYNYTGRLPLDDANTVFSEAYHLVQLKLGKELVLRGVYLNLSAGIDNLLDEKYSLGNDLNAAGGRYYNAAPARNWMVNLQVKW